MTDDHDVSLAAHAFAPAPLPSLEFRPAKSAAPRRHHRGAAALTASVATVAAVAVATTAFMSTGTNAPTAWSATPKHLSSTDSARLDKLCRAGTPPDGAIIGTSGAPGPGTATKGSGPRVEHTEQGVVTGGPVRPKAMDPGSGLPKPTRIGNLPLILVDARGEMTLALYGNAKHHVICTVGPDGRAMITPDAGAWPTGDLINGAATFGNALQAADGTTSASMKLLGTTAPNVTAIAVTVPKVGTVDATVRNGHYALFVPQELLGGTTTEHSTAFRVTPWPAKVTTSDGAVHDTTINGPNPVGSVPN